MSGALAGVAAWAGPAGFFGVGVVPGDAPSNVPTNVWLPDADGRMSLSNAVSADGRVVVGEFMGLYESQAFRWTIDDGMWWLPPRVGERGGYATCASADGGIVGGAVVPLLWSQSVATVWAGETPTGLPLEYPYVRGANRLFGMSADGQVLVSASSDHFSLANAFVWRWIDGQATLVGAGGSATAHGLSADGRRIAGSLGESAVWWDEDNAFHALGGGPGDALAVSADGRTFVGTIRLSLGDRGVVWNDDGSLLYLSNSTRFTRANGVSGDGRLVVGEGDRGAVVYTPERRVELLGAMIERKLGAAPTGWDLLSATGVSADGSVIVGIGVNPQGRYEGFAVYFCRCVADFDGSGGSPDGSDIVAYFDAWVAGDGRADADCSGGTPDASDITEFFRQWLAGGC